MAIQLTTNYQLISSFNLTYGAIRLYAKYNSQSKENNQTYYQLKQVYYCSQSGGYVGFYNGSGTVDGSTRNYGNVYTRMYEGETVIQEVSRTINHNADGSSPTKNVAYSWSASFGGSGSSSVDITFPKIDRYPMINNAPNFNDEENPTINYSTTLGFSGATVEACIANTTGSTIYVPYRAVNVSNGSYTFNLTETERATLRNATPNSNTLDVRFYLKTTTTGGTSYYSYLAKQLSIVNANPTYTYSTQETNTKIVALRGDSADVVYQNASNVKFTIVPTALKGSTITNVSVTNGETSGSDTTSPYEITVPVTVNAFTIKVTDSRGNFTENTVRITMIDYLNVDIKEFSFVRESVTSSNIILNLNATYVQMYIGEYENVPTIKWRLDNGNYNTIPSSSYVWDIQNNRIKINNYQLSNALSYLNTGTFTLLIEDLLTSDTDRQVVIKGITTFDVGEHDFQVNGDLYVADTNRQNKAKIFSNSYSTTEIVIGTYLGKTLYRKMLNIGSLPSSSSKAIYTGYSSGQITIIFAYGSASSGNSTLLIPNLGSSSTNNVILSSISSNVIFIQTSSDKSSYTGYLVIEYTKASD